MNHERLRTQDIVVALALCDRADQTYADLEATTRIPRSVVHSSVQRLRESRLVVDLTPNRSLLLDFLEHGVPFAFPTRLGGPTRGVRTGTDRHPGSGLPEPEGGAWVWPSARGGERGLAVEPLHPSVPDLAEGWLKDALAALDLLRLGRARERAWAVDWLTGQLGRAPTRGLDLGRSDVALEVFSRGRLKQTVAKWVAEPTTAVAHPWARPYLAACGDQVADELAVAIARDTYRCHPSLVVRDEKADGGARSFSVPGLVDALVGRRLADELAESIPFDTRAYVPRTRTTSNAAPGEYDDLLTYSQFVNAQRAAAGRSRAAAVLRTDVADFFPTFDRARAVRVLAQRAGLSDPVANLLDHVLEAWSPIHGFRRSPGIPIDQHDLGRVVSHVCLGLVDERLPDDSDTHYLRFLDDVVVFCADPEAAARLRDRHRDALATLGLRQNTQKTKILDVRTHLDDLDPPEPSHDVLDSGTLDCRRARRLLRIHLGRGTGAVDHFAWRCIVDLPAAREAALAYLATRTFDLAGATHLLDRIVASPDTLVAWRAAEALGDAIHEDGEAFGRLVADRARNVRGLALAPLAGAVARHGHERDYQRLLVDAVVDDGPSSWLAPLQAIEGIRRSLPVAAAPDAVHTAHLATSLSSYGERHSQIANACRSRRGVSASTLPLLRAVVRSMPDPAESLPWLRGLRAEDQRFLRLP